MDEASSDAVYCDEFSWAGRSRGYSRYDYSRWDGYSADIDEQGNVVRLKSDNGYTSESCQLRMIHECLQRGKPFLANGGSALRSINSLPIHRFIEGGNGHGTMAGGHLSAVPLVLGNMGDERSQHGVFTRQAVLRSAALLADGGQPGLQSSTTRLQGCTRITIRNRAGREGEQRLITMHSVSTPGRACAQCASMSTTRRDLVSRDTWCHRSAVHSASPCRAGLVIGDRSTTQRNVRRRHVPAVLVSQRQPSR